MKSFLDIKFKDGLHTPESPKEEFIAHCTNGALTPGQENDINEYNKRLKYEQHEKPIIFIGMDTSSLASGANKIKEAIINELVLQKIDAEIVETGGIGFGTYEPFVDIKLPGKDRIVYSQISVKDIPELLKTSLVKKEIHVKKVFATYGETNEVVTNIKEIPFFKEQIRIVLENCGIINPESIDEYIAAGGFKGLDKALRLMTPETVVKEVLDAGLRGRGGGGFPAGKNGNWL